MGFLCNCDSFFQNMQYISTNGSPNSVDELVREQTHGNEHRTKTINFKALLVSSITMSFEFFHFSVRHVFVTRVLLGFALLVLMEEKISPC